MGHVCVLTRGHLCLVIFTYATRLLRAFSILNLVMTGEKIKVVCDTVERIPQTYLTSDSFL